MQHACVCITHIYRCITYIYRYRYNSEERERELRGRSHQTRQEFGREGTNRPWPRGRLGQRVGGQVSEEELSQSALLFLLLHRRCGGGCWAGILHPFLLGPLSLSFSLQNSTWSFPPPPSPLLLCFTCLYIHTILCAL